MTIEQKINMAAAYNGISLIALALLIGMRPSDFNQKIKTNTLTTGEMEQIAAALGAGWRVEFEFPDGTKI